MLDNLRPYNNIHQICHSHQEIGGHWYDQVELINGYQADVYLLWHANVGNHWQWHYNYCDYYHRISDKYQNFINGPTNKNIVTFDLGLSVVSSIEWGVFGVLYHPFKMTQLRRLLDFYLHFQLVSQRQPPDDFNLCASGYLSGHPAGSSPWTYCHGALWTSNQGGLGINIHHTG